MAVCRAHAGTRLQQYSDTKHISNLAREIRPIGRKSGFPLGTCGGPAACNPIGHCGPQVDGASLAVQVHAADLADVRETLNTIAHAGPDAVAAVSQDVHAAISALEAAPCETPRDTLEPAQDRRAGAAALSSSTILPAQLSSQLRMHVSSGVSMLSTQLQQHGELSARATDEVLRSSNAYVESARQALAGPWASKASASQIAQGSSSAEKDHGTGEASMAADGGSPPERDASL